ncbi:MAG: YARHG domain-containing protein [Deltaproteobacteria bacterium]|nr:YARHG domain-containing protein [Deltaproteobacteria bacterium]
MKIFATIIAALFFTSLATSSSAAVSDKIYLCNSNKTSFEETAHDAFNKRLDVCDLITFSETNLRIIRNSIFARYGRKFKSKDLSSYFHGKDWYKVNPRYHDNLLTEIQLSNVKIIKKTEEIKKIKKIKPTNSREVNGELFHPNFPPFEDFLIQLNRQTVESYVEEFGSQKIRKIAEKHNKSSLARKFRRLTNGRDGDIVNTDQEGHSAIYFSQNGKEFSIGVRETFVNLPDSKAILYSEQIQDSDITEVYSYEGQSIDRIVYMPRYALKANPDLLVTPEFTGCCGTWNYTFHFFNLKNKKNFSTGCPGDECIDTLISWHPEDKRILTIYSSQEYKVESVLSIIDIHGEIVASAILNGDKDEHKLFKKDFYPYVENLVAIRELIPKKQWLIKFVDSEEHYAVLSK